MLARSVPAGRLVIRGAKGDADAGADRHADGYPVGVSRGGRNCRADGDTNSDPNTEPRPAATPSGIVRLALLGAFFVCHLTRTVVLTRHVLIGFNQSGGAISSSSLVRAPAKDSS